MFDVDGLLKNLRTILEDADIVSVDWHLGTDRITDWNRRETLEWVTREHNGSKTITIQINGGAHDGFIERNRLTSLRSQ